MSSVVLISLVREGKLGMNSNLDSVLQKIQKLLALKGSPVQAEAEAAAAKAHELMIKYDLSIQDIPSLQEEITTKAFFDGHNIKQWRIILFNAIAEINFCRVIRSKNTAVYRKDYCWMQLVGKPAHIKTASWMIDYLQEAVIKISRDHIPRNAKYKYRNEFRLGMAYSISFNLRALYSQESNDPATRDLVISEDAALNAYLDRCGVTRTQAKKAPSSRAFQKGVIIGDSVPLNLQVAQA